MHDPHPFLNLHSPKHTPYLTTQPHLRYRTLPKKIQKIVLRNLKRRLPVEPNCSRSNFFLFFSASNVASFMSSLQQQLVAQMIVCSRSMCSLMVLRWAMICPQSPTAMQSLLATTSASAKAFTNLVLSYAASMLSQRRRVSKSWNSWLKSRVIQRKEQQNGSMRKSQSRCQVLGVTA